ncbi:MAG: hypothetical protein GYB31_15970 [Bacteroidetes bacterium]|nr:hypothetical protein [Bacteroidota bacterium]
MALFLGLSLHAQEISSAKERLITVTGSAEVVVQPDEIELTIELQEYPGFAIK